MADFAEVVKRFFREKWQRVRARGSAEQVLESGQPAAKARGLQFLRLDKDRAVFQAGSGNYSFAVR